MKLTTEIDKDLEMLDIDEDLKKEISVYRKLKPYLGHCLTLNHDLNNPLAGVLGFAEYLLLDESNPLSQDHKESVEQIFKAAERMKSLIETLCKEKISLSEEIDLDVLISAFQKEAKELD